ncbi:hypothetical protein JCM10908_006047 [Rhodotorula pacifica]|uniref:uncharacterized protein n=1 Tax=Rhodotorula pacifica TaxID=1495444 RepID=UPI00316E5730
MRLLGISSLVLGAALAVQPALAQTSVSNIETFPTILDPTQSTGPVATTSTSTSTAAAAGTPFDPNNFPTGPGPAIIPNITALPTLSSTSGAGSASSSASGNRTTFVSASKVSYSSLPTDSVVTSTVGGSVTTVTITSSSAGGSSAARTQAPSSGAESVARSRSGVAAGALAAIAAVAVGYAVVV